MNMMAALADNSDRIDDDGDVDCEDVELVLRDLLPPLPVVVVDQSPPNKVPVVLDVLDKLFKLSRLNCEEDDKSRREKEGRVNSPLNQNQCCLRRYELWCNAMGEQVGEAEGEPQRGDAGDHQVRHHSTQVQVPDPILVKLLNGFFEPPVRPHEGQCYRDLGVHRPQCPVLPQEVDRALVKGDSNRGEDDKLEEEAKEEGNEAHQQGHRDHGLAGQLCPLSKSVSKSRPTLPDP